MILQNICYNHKVNWKYLGILLVTMSSVLLQIKIWLLFLHLSFRVQWNLISAWWGSSLFSYFTFFICLIHFRFLIIVLIPLGWIWEGEWGECLPTLLLELTDACHSASHPLLLPHSRLCLPGPSQLLQETPHLWNQPHCQGAWTLHWSL